MNLNTIVFEGNLAATPKLDRTANGTAVTDAVVLVKDADVQWVDAEPTRHRIKAWKTLAEHLANLPTGTTVLVVGTITTDAWAEKTAHGGPSSTRAAGSDDD